MGIQHKGASREELEIISMRIDIEEVRGIFEQWITLDPIPELMIGWDRFDPQTNIVFLHILGNWTQEHRAELNAYIKELDRRLIIGIIDYGDNNTDYDHENELKYFGGER
jgi:hypothetical protein